MVFLGVWLMLCGLRAENAQVRVVVFVGKFLKIAWLCAMAGLCVQSTWMTLRSPSKLTGKVGHNT